MAPTLSTDSDAAEKYFHAGPFDRAKIRSEFIAKFSKEPRYNSASINDLDTLIGFIEADSRITDIRWMAYMLATAYWETSHLVKKRVPSVNKKTHKLQMREIKVWRNMSFATEESGYGAGERYFLPVKVRRLRDGTAIVTEYDGDQWAVNLRGISTPIQRKVDLGTSATAQAAQGFIEDDGEEHAYYGRGYVQLTWWANYALNGAAIGEGLNLLFHPERAREPKISYGVISTGMLTGAGFAHGHKFSEYFQGAHTRYVDARAMVNGSDCAVDIARIAQLFEEVLLENKVAGSPAIAAVTSAVRAVSG